MTGKLPYVRFYMSDWLSATRGMKANEIGVYFTMLALMYERGEPLPEDYTRLSRQCGCTPKTCETIVSTLLKEGKLYRSDDGLWAPVIDKWEGWSSEDRILPKALRKAVILRDGERCAYCGSEEGPFHIDHIHPWSRGGKHVEENLTVACRPCNLSKSDKTLSEWGFLQ